MAPSDIAPLPRAADEIHQDASANSAPRARGVGQLVRGLVLLGETVRVRAARGTRRLSNRANRWRLQKQQHHSTYPWPFLIFSNSAWMTFR